MSRSLKKARAVHAAACGQHEQTVQITFLLPSLRGSPTKLFCTFTRGNAFKIIMNFDAISPRSNKKVLKKNLNSDVLAKTEDIGMLLCLMVKSDLEIQKHFGGMASVTAKEWWSQFFQYHPETFALFLFNYLNEDKISESDLRKYGMIRSWTAMMYCMPYPKNLARAEEAIKRIYMLQKQLYRVRNVFIQCHFTSDNHPGEGRREIYDV